MDKTYKYLNASIENINKNDDEKLIGIQKEFNKKFDNLSGKRLWNINFKKRKYFFKIRKNDLNNKVIKMNKQIHQFA